MVDIDEDYFLDIISSLPPAMSNFASSQLAAALFLAAKTLTTNDLISMLIEEADRQKVQYVQQKGSEKGKEEDSEVLAVGELFKKEREGETRVLELRRFGHFKNKCLKPKQEKKPAQAATANAAVSDSEEGA